MRFLLRPVIVLVAFPLAFSLSCAPAPDPGGVDARAADRPQACEPAPDRLCPVDEGSGDAEFTGYRTALVQAVANRDMEAFRGMVDPAIRTSFGPGGGFDALIQQWETASGSSALWEELDTILGGGGAFRGEGDDRSFWAPYVYAIWPEDVDAFEHVAATGRRVVVRERPETRAGEVARVDHEILELVRREEESAEWLRVRTPAGVEGWVAESDVRSPIGYRAGFNRNGGTWRMTALVAGD
ncbi:MAG: SH3 domain-containing protein [Thermoanaerobaculia bacterium]